MRTHLFALPHQRMNGQGYLASTKRIALSDLRGHTDLIPKQPAESLITAGCEVHLLRFAPARSHLSDQTGNPLGR